HDLEAASLVGVQRQRDGRRWAVRRISRRRRQRRRRGWWGWWAGGCDDQSEDQSREHLSIHWQRANTSASSRTSLGKISALRGRGKWLRAPAVRRSPAPFIIQ